MNENKDSNFRLAIEFFPALAAMIGMVLVICQLMTPNSLPLTLGVIGVGSVALVGYALQVFCIPNRTNFTAEICTFCWLFIVTMNIMKLIALGSL